MSKLAQSLINYRAFCEREGLMDMQGNFPNWLLVWYGPAILRKTAARLLSTSNEGY